MRKLLMALVGFALFATAGVAVAGMCGIKPIIPIGCKDMVAVCVCDQYGNNCVWTWQCVAR